MITNIAIYLHIMFTRISTKREKAKTYQYLQLCQSYRNEKGQPRTRVLINFGRLDQLDQKKIDQAVEALLAYSSNPAVPRVCDIQHISARDYGDMLALVNIWARLRIAQSIRVHLGKRKLSFDVADLVKVMVLNRVSDPLSKLGIMRWLPTVFIPELREQVSYPNLLRAMDYLIGIKDKIERDLYNELVNLFNLKVEVIFMDLTSSYFEGQGPQLARWGYSRDRRPDRKQLVLALVVTKEGIPIYHEVFPGNTTDVTTLVPIVEVLRGRFHIERCILVCDRGMVSDENLSFLDQHGIPYIVAIRRRGTRESDELIGKTLRGFRKLQGLEGLLVKEVVRGGIRYVLCHNPEVAKQKRQRREERIKQVQSQIDALNVRYRKGRLSAQELYHRAVSLLKEHQLRRYFEPKVEKNGLILYMDPDHWDRESFLDGKFFLKTRLSADEISTADLVRVYKQLSHIEGSFRELKDFLKIRPIFHWTDRRVRAHVMICVLAYLLEKVVELYCRRARLNISPRRALWVLSQLKAVELRLGDQYIAVTTELQQKMKEILQALKVPLPEKIIENQMVR